MNSDRSNENNVLPSLVCWSCSSSSFGSDCFHPSVNTNVCESRAGKCYTLVTNNTVIRGCVGDEIIPDATQCDDPSSCSICSNR